MTAAAPLLRLTAAQVNTLRGEAEAAYPLECCGLVVGRHAGPATLVATRLVPAANRHADPRHAFDLDPAAHIALLRQLRGGGDEVLLGHYHSHPDSPAMPSARDLAQANEPLAVWLIVPVKQGQAGAIAAWRARPGEGGVEGFDPLVVEVAELP
jgi:proteasome lid subunit RPN8/RPN11